MKKVVYIIGPYRSVTPWHVDQNVRKAEFSALVVAQLGGIPLCDHSMYRFFDKICSDDFWLQGTSELLRRSDAVYVLNNYEDSVGSMAEVRLARELGLPVFIEGKPDVRKEMLKFIEGGILES